MTISEVNRIKKMFRPLFARIRISPMKANLLSVSFFVLLCITAHATESKTDFGRRKKFLLFCLIAYGLMLQTFPILAQIPNTRPMTRTKTFIDYFLPTSIVASLTTNAWGGRCRSGRAIRRTASKTRR